MSKLARLKKAKDLSDLAKLMGFTPKAVSYVLYKLPAASKYRVFEIEKKGGGTRTIKAPVDHLSLLQSRLNELLEECVREIAKNNSRFLAASHGFRKGRSIISNANSHRKRRYVFNVDIADFFGSINFGRVRGLFIKDRAFGLAPAVATVIAQIACHENALPQGSPCSPTLSNLVANILDARILRLSKKARCTYTRYADDLTFSTNEQIFPEEIANEVAGSIWEPGRQLIALIEGAGFKLNPDKTRMSRRRSRQTVTGLTVNIKPNIQQDYYRKVRAMCASVFSTGKWHRPVTNPDDSPTLTDNLRPLEGMLSHINFVKARLDRSRKANKDIGYTAPRAPVELYRRFLFYKHFVANQRAVLVTEGETDIIYLKCAVVSRASHFPSLTSLIGGHLVPAFSFLNPSRNLRTILNLNNGTAGQTQLINEYESRLKRYRHLPMHNPVIIVCDNDQGSKDLFKAAEKKAGKAISMTTTDGFYHLGSSLYLVKVPEGAAPAPSKDIEELFAATVLGTLLDGKSFDKKKEPSDPTTYGKVDFAEKVVRPNMGTIDFSGFDQLLGRIADCISDYAAKSIPKAATLSMPAVSAGAI